MTEIAGVARVRRFSTLLAATLVATVAALSALDVAAAQALPPGDWTLAFNDEFSSAGVNAALWTKGWQHEGTSYIKGECLSSSHVSQPGNGYLYLELRSDGCGAGVESNPYDGVPGHAGFSYSYGYVEWRAYVPGIEPPNLGCPKGGCLPDWPALWGTEVHGGEFPEETEIDTMEGLTSKGRPCFHFHHWKEPIEHLGGCAPETKSYAGWHTYAADWEPGTVNYYYDGVKVGQLSSAYINSNPQFLTMDMLPPCSGCGQPNQIPDTMVIDYVRVWQHPPGDFNGDGHTDVMGIESDGTLLLYEGNGSGGWLNGGNGINVGNGWNMFTHGVIGVGDFNGDGHTDLMGVKTDGTSWLYEGNGSGGWLNGGNGINVGNGWNVFTQILGVADFNGDGYPDVMGVKSDGTLLLYEGNGSGGWLNGGNGINVGFGWNAFTHVVGVGDFNGDGHPDVMGVESDGTLLLYEGNGSGGWLNGGNGINVGFGWNVFTTVIGWA
jgi:FG-GAP-like repeat/Glycosyl hydrolases family 16